MKTLTQLARAGWEGTYAGYVEKADIGGTNARRIPTHQEKAIRRGKAKARVIRREKAKARESTAKAKGTERTERAKALHTASRSSSTGTEMLSGLKQTGRRLRQPHRQEPLPRAHPHPAVGRPFPSGQSLMARALSEDALAQ